MSDVTLTVETQGSAGTQEAPAEAIARADVLVIAADIGVTGLKRFSDKPQVKVPIRKAVNEPTAVSYTHLTLPTTLHECRSRWSPSH